MEGPRYTIDQLVEVTGLPRRTIRYYVQEGLLEPPAGRGRGGFYNDSHIERLRQIMADRARGLSLDAIRSHIAGAGVTAPAMYQHYWTRYEVAPGVELHVRGDVERGDMGRIVAMLREAKSMMKEGTDEQNGST